MSRELQTPTFCIIVTGVGAIIGQGIAKSLRQSGFDVTIIGVDKQITPFAQSLCDLCVEKPKVDEEDSAYLDFWMSLIVEQQVDLIIPGLEVDVFFLNQHRQYFLNTCIALNNPTLIELAKDKWHTFQFLQRAHVVAIPSLLPESWQECLTQLGSPPYILKPRCGNGSRGIVELEDESDFLYWKRKVKYSFLVQPKIGSDETEYTAAAFGLGDGRSLAPIIFRRKLSVAGNTQYAEVCEEPGIVELIAQLSQLLSPVGPTNYQFRKHGDLWYLLEINPRISSSNSLRTAFGYNEAAMCVAYYLLQQEPSPVTITSGKGWRYYEDFVR